MKRSTIKSLLIDILIVVCVVFAITAVIKPTIVKGESMEDTLHDGNYLILNRMAYKMHSPERGDIVVFPSELDGGKLLIKRVIGVGGDVVETDGLETSVNDSKLDEPYIKSSTFGDGLMETWTVPEGKVFVMGDNRDNSADSRQANVGFIDEDDIIGKVAVRLFPFSEIGTVK
ncbi:MAG: signal peptidase I [Bacillota bacterium]|nr:signal peptidase I [Bacillota bacterium]